MTRKISIETPNTSKSMKCNIYYDDNEVRIKNIKDCGISMQVAILPLTENIDMMSYIQFCRVYPDQENTITSLKFLVKNKDKSDKVIYRGDYPINDPFPNSVNGRISIRNIVFKVFKNSIHVTGHTDKEECLMIGNMILGNIKDSNNFISECLKNRKLFKECCQWLLENSKGEKIDLEVESDCFSSLSETGELMNVYMFENTESYTIEIDRSSTPEEYKYFVSELIERTSCSGNHNELQYRIRRMRTELKRIRQLNIEHFFEMDMVFRYRNIMTVGHYNVGFKINKQRLASVLNENDFICNPCDDLRRPPSALYYHEGDIEDLHRKDDNDTHDEFTFTKTGKITHSSVGGEIMKDMYNKFFLVIATYLDYIRLR